MKSPLVSIIINCYNGHKYLKQAVESVINQTYKNWEIIFWDVSTNNKSKKIIKKLISDKRIRYFKKKKDFLYNSRNEAVKKSYGKLIAFLDCDDTWVPNKLEIQVSLFEKKKNVAMVYSNYFTFFQNKNLFIPIKDKYIYSGYIQKKILNNYRIGILTVVIKKNIFNKLGGFKKNFHLTGDFEFNIRLSKKNKIIGIKKPLAFYRIHEKNISKNLQLELTELENCFKIFQKNKINKNILINFNKYIIYKKLFYNIIYRRRKLCFKSICKLVTSKYFLKVILLIVIPNKILFFFKKQ